MSTKMFSREVFRRTGFELDFAECTIFDCSLEIEKQIKYLIISFFHV